MILGKQVSLRRAVPVAGVAVIQVASTIKGSLSAIANRGSVQITAALTVLKTRYAAQVEDPNIIYRVAVSDGALTAPTERVLPLGTGPSKKGR